MHKILPPQHTMMITIPLHRIFPEKTGQSLVIDIQHRIVMLIKQLNTESRVQCSQVFPDGALRILMILLVFPSGLSYESLLIALESPLQDLSSMMEHPSSSLPRRFLEKAEHISQLFAQKTREEREKYLRPLRRAITFLDTNLPLFCLSPHRLTRAGYSLFSIPDKYRESL